MAAISRIGAKLSVCLNTEKVVSHTVLLLCLLSRRNLASAVRIQLSWGLQRVSRGYLYTAARRYDSDSDPDGQGRKLRVLGKVAAWGLSRVVHTASILCPEARKGCAG